MSINTDSFIHFTDYFGISKSYIFTVKFMGRFDEMKGIS